MDVMEGAAHPGVETDPVCGMKVQPGKAAATAEHGGQTWFFCGQGCFHKFTAEPARYDGSAVAPAAEPIAAGTRYTCPMHPQIVQEEPGACPICGMALEPQTVEANAGPSAELVDMTRRFWIGLVLTVPLLAVMVGEMVPSLQRLLMSRAMGWVEMGLATPVVLWAGWPFFERGWASVVHRSLNMFTLIALGAGAAFVSSAVAVVLPGLFPGGRPGLYFEAAAVIIVLVLLGQVLELRARAATGGALQALLGLSPKTARRIAADGTETEVPLAEIRAGDRLRLRPGEKVPVDGRVVEGTSAVDEAMVTGEAVPVAKGVGAQMMGGTINGTGGLVMQAERVGAETVLAQIVRMVSEAQRTRAPIQRVADAVAGWFVPVVLAAAAMTFGVWMAVGPQPRLSHALVSAVAVLIIACPCSLGLATPMAIMVGMGRGAGAGVLVRDAEALERLEKVDTLVVDKTGTLTEGRPRVTRVVAAEGFDEAGLLQSAASLEAASEHPLAGAVVAGATERGLVLLPVAGFASETGQGVRGEVNGEAVAVGTETLLAGMAVASVEADALRREGQTVLFVARGGRYAGMIAVADPIKASTAEAVRELQAAGLRLLMLTGDNATTAKVVAERLGIAFEAGVSPAGKAEAIARLQAEGRVVAMAGDGVNDAPALAKADVGIAMGTGTDVAMATSGITLMHGDLRGILKARRLSQRTMRNIRQNLFLSFAYNVLGVPIAAGVLYPLTGLLLSPMLAAAAMSLSSVSVIGNALRLKAARL